MGGVATVDRMNGCGVAIERNITLTAANTAVYRLPVDARNGIKTDLRTHDYHVPICTFPQPLGHRIVIFVCNL